MIISLASLPGLRQKYSSKRIVLVGGTYDILHAGHIDYLEFARSQGDVLVVAMSDDRSVRAAKGDDRPVNNEEDRAAIINALKPVDFVVLADKYDGVIKEVGELLHPDIFVLYCDIPKEVTEELHENFPESRILIDNREKTNSTTATIAKIRSNKA